MIEFLREVAGGRPLPEHATTEAMHRIMAGDATPAQIAGFVMGLAARGETTDEITGLARAARELARPWPGDTDVLDTCGTGGDGLGTFNISTTAAIVAAACGVRVAKHGNRSVSSSCGSADVLEALGVRIDLGPEDAARCLQSTGITFLFAPLFHPSFRHAAAARRELGVRTVFNLVGPLANPARARFQILGVPVPEMVSPMADVLTRLGVSRALVFSSRDGMDELSTGAVADVVEISGARREDYQLDPAELGVPHADAGKLAGGDRAANAAIISGVLAGQTGPTRDVVVLNAAAAIRVYGKADTWQAGLDTAREALDSGAAAEVLNRWRATSQELAASDLWPRGAA